MSVNVEVETIINRPIAVVAAYAGDPSNAPHWYRRIDSADWMTDVVVQAIACRDFVSVGRCSALPTSDAEPDPMLRHRFWPSTRVEVRRHAVRRRARPASRP